MSRLLHPDRALLITTFVVVVLAFLPTRWLVPWTSDVGSVIALPLTPLGHAAGSVLAFVRPPMSEEIPDASELDRVLAERDAFRGRWHRARLRVEQLEGELAQLQRARARGIGGDWVPRTAAVVRHAPARSGGLLSLNVGRRQGVVEGTVAVVDGDRLVGRVAPDVATLSSILIPVGTMGDAYGRDLRARVLPAEEETTGADKGVSIRLEPIGGGHLVGLLERGSGVKVGDFVRLGADPAWQPTAWGMLLGRVVRIETMRQQPLRERIVVQRAVDPDRLPAVTLKLERQTDETPAARASVGGEDAR